MNAANTPATRKQAHTGRKSVSFAAERTEEPCPQHDSDTSTPGSALHPSGTALNNKRPSSPWSARRRMSAGSTPGTKGGRQSSSSSLLANAYDNDDDDEQWIDEPVGKQHAGNDGAVEAEPEAATIVTGDVRLGGSPSSPQLVNALQSTFDASGNDVTAGIPGVMQSGDGSEIEGWLFKIGSKDSSPPERSYEWTTAGEELESQRATEEFEQQASHSWMFATPVGNAAAPSLDMQAGFKSVPRMPTATPALKAPTPLKAAYSQSPVNGTPTIFRATPLHQTSAQQQAMSAPPPPAVQQQSLNTACDSESAAVPFTEYTGSHPRKRRRRTAAHAPTKRQRKRQAGLIALWQERAERLRQMLVAERKVKERMIQLLHDAAQMGDGPQAKRSRISSRRKAKSKHCR